MADKFQPWQETREKLKSAGISDADIDKGLKTMQIRAGPACKDMNALYYMTARVHFKIDVPKITTLGKGRGASDEPGKRIVCKDINPHMAQEAADNDTKFEIAGFIYNAAEGLTKNGKPKYEFTIMDHTGSLDIEAYGGAVESLKELNLQNGDYIYIDHLQISMWRPDDAKPDFKPWINFKVPPWAKPEKVQAPQGYTLSNCFKDAMTNLVQDGELAFVRGMVLDDDQGDKEYGAKSFVACEVSHYKVDKDTQSCGKTHDGDCVPIEKSWRRLCVSPGGRMFTVSFDPEQHPKEQTLEGYGATFFCRFGKKYSEYTVLWYELGADRELPTAKEVFEPAAQKTSAPKKEPSALKAPIPPVQHSGGPRPEKRLVVQAPPKQQYAPPPKPEVSPESMANIDALVQKLDEGKGAPWEDLIPEALNQFKYDEAFVEENLNHLMDAGTLWEPVLGRLKSHSSPPEKTVTQQIPGVEDGEVHEEEAEQEVTLEMVLSDIKIPADKGFREAEVKAALVGAGYDADATLKELLDGGLVTKRVGRYFPKTLEVSPTHPQAPAAQPAPKVESSKAAAPAKISPKVRPPTKLPQAAQDVLVQFVQTYGQNPASAIKRKLKEKVPDQDPEVLVQQAVKDGWVTLDPSVAKSKGIDNPGGKPENPFIFWIGG